MAMIWIPIGMLLGYWIVSKKFHEKFHALEIRMQDIESWIADGVPARLHPADARDVEEARRGLSEAIGLASNLGDIERRLELVEARPTIEQAMDDAARKAMDGR